VQVEGVAFSGSAGPLCLGLHKRTLEAMMHGLTRPTVAAVALCMTMFVADDASGAIAESW
jgi:hypothetical protein